MATIKKACKGVSYPKSSNVSKRLGSPSKAKSGGSFPDLNKDGKITKKDILIGKGVLPKTAKKGMKVKKAQDGKIQPMGNATKVGEGKYKSEDKNYKMKFKGGSDKDMTPSTSMVQRRTLKGFLSGAPRAAGKVALKKGGKMTKKCAYGCK